VNRAGPTIYTLVWVGWEFDVAATSLRLSAPPVTLAAGESLHSGDDDGGNQQRFNRHASTHSMARKAAIQRPADTLGKRRATTRY